jgi:hypothetical protein
MSLNLNKKYYFTLNNIIKNIFYYIFIDEPCRVVLIRPTIDLRYQVSLEYQMNII